MLFRSPAIYPATSTTGLATVFWAIGGFGIQSTYSSGDPVVSSATFAGQTLAGLGFTTPGLLGTWTLAVTNDTINVVVGAPPASASAPGPLPVFGAAAAFGYSRRLRRRVSQSSSSAPLSATISN